MANRRWTDNTMANRRWTDNTMANRRWTDNTMTNRKMTKGQTKSYSIIFFLNIVSPFFTVKIKMIIDEDDHRS
jgi:hypothetical protein